MTENDVTMLWRRLFRGQPITGLTLTKAESLLDELSPESPLRLRLSEELDDLRRLYQKP